MEKEVNRISGISVRGFKSLYEEQHIEIRPLTILAGANSSGKSSIMQPLLLLKQTLEAPGDPGAILLDGEHVKFSSAEQLLSQPIGEKPESSFTVSISLQTEVDDLIPRQSLLLRFQREKGKGFTLAEMKAKAMGAYYELKPEMTHGEILAALGFPIPKQFIGISSDEEPYWSVVRDRCLLKARYSETLDVFAREDISPGAPFLPFIRDVIHLPGLRGNPKRTYPRNAIAPQFPGTFDQYTASVIAEWQEQKDDKLKALGNALEELGLTWKVRAEQIDDTQVQLKVGRLPHSSSGGPRDMVSIADIGFGVSQTLPVLVALLAARPGQLVYLEQPEIHLHPLAQRRMASILVNAAKSGAVVVAETHSSLLLLEIQTLVAKGSIVPGDIAFHWFARDKNGRTSISTAVPDKNGAYGDWPVDFDRTELEAEQAYLDAVEFREVAR